MSEKMSMQDCVHEWLELQTSNEGLPPSDDRAEVKKAITDIRDLMIKADVQPKYKDEYVDRIGQILLNLKKHGDTEM